MTCENKDKDKRCAECMDCKKRVAYADGLGMMAYSVPMEFSDMRGAHNMSEEQNLYGDGLKVCKDPQCEAGGSAQPLENFGKAKTFISSKNPEGYNSRCKSCLNRRAREMRNAKKHKFGIIEKKLKVGVLATALDTFLDGYPDLKNDLKELAGEEMRSLENQVAFMLTRNIQIWKRRRNELQ